MAKLTIEVLLSCMRQKDCQIIKRSNLKTDAIVINQSDCNKVEKVGSSKCCTSVSTFISTTERGLSKSRNMALRNATADICLICDDDEILDDDYPGKILRAFEENPTADVIAFQIDDAGKKYPAKKKKIGYIGALKLASWQLAFRRKSIISNGIKFDETLGSGVSKAGGEENMFLYDCLRRGLNIIFVPITIGRMIEGESQWFHGCSANFFEDKGKLMTKLLGRRKAIVYGLYFLTTKYHWYRKDIGLIDASKCLFNGILLKPQ